MKKLILSATMMTGLSLVANAQQVLFQDGGSNSYDTEINGVPNTTQDLNLELLVGSSGTATIDVVTLLLSQTTATETRSLGTIQPAKGDITAFLDINDQSVNAYDVGNAGLTGFLDYQVLAWTGNYSTYAAALASGDAFVGISPVLVFNQAIEPAYPAVGIDLDSNPINLVSDPINPVSNLVPEPSTLAMATVGISSMLVFGCRKFVRLG